MFVQVLEIPTDIFHVFCLLLATLLLLHALLPYRPFQFSIVEAVPGLGEHLAGEFAWIDDPGLFWRFGGVFGSNLLGGGDVSSCVSFAHGVDVSGGELHDLTAAVTR